MAYQSTPEDTRRAWLVGLCYVLLIIGLSYMLFKIWPPVPWPSEQDARDNPALAAALEKSLGECSPMIAPARTSSPATTLTPTATPASPKAGTPTTTPQVAANANLSTRSDESVSPDESVATKQARADKALSQALIGNIPINFFGRWCISTTFDERLIMLVIIAGMLGSFVHGATSLADYIGNNNFNRSWTWFYILRPPIGMALALVFYFVIRGGFLTTSGGAKDINPYGIAALAGLVGMFSKQATDKLGEVFSTLFRAAAGEGDDKRSGSLNPEPITVTSVDPQSVLAGSTNQVITVNGANFPEGSTIYVNNGAQATTFVSAAQLTAQIDDALLAAAATLKLKVVTEDGSESAAVDFTVT